MEPIATFEKVSFEQFLKDAYRLTLNQAEEAAQEANMTTNEFVAEMQKA